MRRARLPRLTRAGILLLCAFAFPGAVGPARAGDPAFTGLVATANDAETAGANPAGMTRLEETTRALRLVVGHGFGDFDVNQGKTTVDGGNPDSDNVPLGIPLFYLVKPFHEDWRFGLSFTVPAGFGSDYGNDWAGRYYSERFSLVYVALTPSLAYRIDDHWSVGLGIQTTYSYSESVIRLNNPGQEQDGKFEYEADAVGVTGSASLLYQFDDRTRVGLVYTGKTSTDLEGDIELSRLGPLLSGTIGNLDGKELEVENILPQRLTLGLYHELEGGHYVTLDGLWIDFSDFGTGNVSVDGDRVISPDGIYDDIWGLTLGFGYQRDERTTWKAGFMYLSDAVGDDDRTLSLALDRVWGLGIGFTRRYDHARSLDVNLSFYDTGEAPVDTGPDPLRGRVVGKTNDPYGVSLDFTWHW
jgi:long-chain fatty acid transport protein